MTHKTFDTFASDWTQCTNVAFDKLLKKFQLQNAGHKVRYICLQIVGGLSFWPKEVAKKQRFSNA
jgi:hypothetical protein